MCLSLFCLIIYSSIHNNYHTFEKRVAVHDHLYSESLIRYQAIEKLLIPFVKYLPSLQPTIKSHDSLLQEQLYLHFVPYVGKGHCLVQFNQ